jgi:hypothetical protein
VELSYECFDGDSKFLVGTAREQKAQESSGLTYYCTVDEDGGKVGLSQATRARKAMTGLFKMQLQWPQI